MSTISLEEIRKIPISDIASLLSLHIDAHNKLRCYNSSAHKHGDIHPSLSLDITNNRFKCFSCGVSGSGIDLTMGYKNIDFKEAVEQLEKSFFSKVVREYSLTDIKSWKLSKKRFDEFYDYSKYIKARFRDPKDRKNKQDIFFTRTSSGKFVKGRRCSPALFNSKELQHRLNDTVCYVEGESCVNVLKSLGYLATTAGSATVSSNTFSQEMLSKFEDRSVVIFPDNDSPGSKLIHDLAALIHSKVKILRFADIKTSWMEFFNVEMPEKADIKDFIERFKKTHGDAGLNESVDSMIATAKPVDLPVIVNDSVGTIRAKYFDGRTFIPQYLTQEILNNRQFLYTDKQFFHFDEGYWRVVDSDFIAQFAKNKLGSLSTITRINETINDLKLSTLLKQGLQLNSKNEFINLKNGMLNWIQSKLLPHDSGLLSTIRINASYDPNAKCPRFMQFLDEVLSSDTIPIIQEFMGYTLIQDVRFEKAFMLIGKGANGKGTLLGLLIALLGKDNVAEIPLQNLSDRFNTAQLNGKLANIFMDLNSKAMLDTGHFKAVVSGDRLTVERKHQDHFSFEPFCRLVFSCNEIPRSYDRTYAFYRRWIIIPFDKTFSGAHMDKSLKSKLLKELDGILLWSLEGLYRLFKQQDFSRSKTSTEMLDCYKISNDNVLQFTNDNCLFGDNYMTDKKDLYGAYKNFCNDNSLRTVSQRRFNSDLLDKNTNVYETRNNFSNRRAWKGIGLREN